METQVNLADITHPITLSMCPSIKAVISAAYEAKPHPDAPSSAPSSVFTLRAIFAPHSTFILSLSPLRFPHRSNRQVAGQAVHYFKFTACPLGTPRGGIKSGFGWRGDLGSNSKLLLLRFHSLI